MTWSLEELEKITKAIHSSYELLQSDEWPQRVALESLKEAELSLNRAIDH